MCKISCILASSWYNYRVFFRLQQSRFTRSADGIQTFYPAPPKLFMPNAGPRDTGRLAVSASTSKAIAQAERDRWQSAYSLQNRSIQTPSLETRLSKKQVRILGTISWIARLLLQNNFPAQYAICNFIILLVFCWSKLSISQHYCDILLLRFINVTSSVAQNSQTLIPSKNFWKLTFLSSHSENLNDFVDAPLVTVGVIGVRNDVM